MLFWNKNIIDFRPKFLGIDIGDRTVRIFQIERNGQEDKIKGYASFNIKKGSIENGKIIEKSEVIFALTEALKKAPFSTRKVVCSLPESKVFLRIISLPPMEEAEAQRAIKWEMEANIPLPIESVYFAWQFITEKESAKQRVLTVAVQKEIVDNLREVLEGAGLEPYVFEAKSIAHTRSLIAEKTEKAALDFIVDLGPVKTNFTIVENGVPCFALSVPFSSESINDAITKKMHVNEAEREQIKINHGVDNSSGDNPLFNSVEAVMENLAGEMENAIDFYLNSSEKNEKIERIIISGEGANLKGLADYLKNRLKKEVLIGNPWINLKLKEDTIEMSPEEAVKFATAIGLALRGLYDEN
jgi:type IV pilus assembly protein PilM